MTVKRNWNQIAARAAEYLTSNPGANKEQLYSYIRMIADGCSLSNCALACAHLGAALVSRRATTGTHLKHWLNGAMVPESVVAELRPLMLESVLASRVPDASA